MGEPIPTGDTQLYVVAETPYGSSVKRSVVRLDLFMFLQSKTQGGLLATAAYEVLANVGVKIQ